MTGTPAKYSFVILVIYLLIDANVAAQVINDNIESRIALTIEEYKSSNTDDCSLQWSCINKPLTRKCIQYHNDQWFFFNSGDHEELYVNVSGQDCRDRRGIQVIIIDGEAYEPETYTILKCVSFGNHDDVFFKLDSLERHKEYLVQIDGYLNDYCSFQIEVSKQPKGIPLKELFVDDSANNLIAENIVELQWDVTDSIAHHVEHYEIWRMFESEYRSMLVAQVGQEYNARRRPKLQYAIQDSLIQYGSYSYKIIAANKNKRSLISSTSIYNPKPKHAAADETDWLRLELYYPYKCKLKISVFDAKKRVLLNYFRFNYSFENQTFETYIKNYREEGISEFRVEVENLGNGEKQNKIIKK